MTVVRMPGRANGSAAESGPAPRDRQPTTIAAVISEWREHGPLVHELTGIAALDELTGGGPCYGTRWYLSGAPDAGKTALLVQIAHVYAVRGICVGLLAADEDAGDLVTRLAQRVGYSRVHCETRDHAVLEQMATVLEPLPIRIYDGSWTIEAAASDLAGWAGATERRAMLGVDSVQTVTCAAELLAERPMADVQAVTARTRAIRAAATQHRLIGLVTSELGRGSYASRDPSQRTSALAGSKWSGAIEYSARVLLALRSVAGESDLLELEIAKSKHGPTTTGEPDRPHVYLRIDRRSQTLSETSYEPAPAEDRDERAREQTSQDAAGVLATIEAEPGIETRDLYAAAKAASGIGRCRVDAAVRSLGDRIERRPGPRGSRRHYPAGCAP